MKWAGYLVLFGETRDEIP